MWAREILRCSQLSSAGGCHPPDPSPCAQRVALLDGIGRLSVLTGCSHAHRHRHADTGQFPRHDHLQRDLPARRLSPSWGCANRPRPRLQQGDQRPGFSVPQPRCAGLVVRAGDRPRADQYRAIAEQPRRTRGSIGPRPGCCRHHTRIGQLQHRAHGPVRSDRRHHRQSHHGHVQRHQHCGRRFWTSSRRSTFSRSTSKAWSWMWSRRLIAPSCPGSRRFASSGQIHISSRWRTTMTPRSSTRPIALVCAAVVVRVGNWAHRPLGSTAFPASDACAR